VRARATATLIPPAGGSPAGRAFGISAG